MSELPMRGHFGYLRFKTFPTTPRTPQCEVFFPLLSSSEHSGVPEDSKSQLFQVLGFTLTLGQVRVATFMVVDTDSYDVMLGLDFLIKIRAIVDVERGLIQVRHGPGANVEVLPLTMVNMLQKMNLETLGRDVAVALEATPLNGDLNVDFGKLSVGDPILTGQTDMMVSDTADDCEGGH